MKISPRAISTFWLGIALSPGFLPSTARADLFVSSQTAPTASHVLQYDGMTGATIGIFDAGGRLADPLGLTFGPDGNLYVASANSDQVLRYDGATGAFMGVFASGGGMQSPSNLTFGPDGNLYVSSSCCQVMRFNGTTGAFMGVFATLAGFDYPRGLAFGPDGNLYVVSYNTGSVVRFDGITGEFIDDFVPAGSGGLFTPSDLAFGPDANLYVTGGTFPSPGVFRYNGATGAFINKFASVGDGLFPIGMAFGPDGNLYVVLTGAKFTVRRFDAITGAFIDDFITNGSGGLSNPFGIAFSPSLPVELTCPEPAMVECGAAVVVTAVVKDPGGQPVAVIWTVNGSMVSTNYVPATNPPTAFQVSLTAELPVGTNLIGVTAASSFINPSVCSTTVTVVDTTPPHIFRARAMPDVLWPPNHRLVPVRINVRADDACGPATCKIKCVRSNEPDGRPGRDRLPDWIITGDLSLKLRAEKSGSKRDRIYTITVECEDASGNTCTRDVTVKVPHDHGGNRDDHDDHGHGHGDGGNRGR